MNDIEIKDLTSEELEYAATRIKRLTTGVIDNVANTMTAIRNLGEHWEGPKYNFIVETWNTDVAPTLFRLLEEWDQKTNTMFQELVEQYKSVMTGDDFIDLSLVVDPDYYRFINKPIDVQASNGTLYEKEFVERILHYEFEGYLGNVAPGVRNVVTILNENLAKGSSNALTLFKEKAYEYANSVYNEMSTLLDGFMDAAKTRSSEIDTIEERARVAIQNI